MSKVSVIMPAYNRAQYISAAIESVLNQTFQDFELIIVDDCSTDTTAEIARSFEDRYPDKIRLVQHETNRGVATARNTGIQHSRYDVLMMADTDDIQYENRLQVTYEEMMNTGADLVFNDCKMINSHGQDLHRTKGYPNELTSHNVDLKLLERNYFWTSLVLIRKNLDVYFDENIKSSEDYDLFLRLALKGYRFVICPAILTAYRVHESNLSADGKVAQDATKYIINKLDLRAVHQQLSDKHGLLAADEALASAYLWINQPESVVELLKSQPIRSFNSTFILAVSYFQMKDLAYSFKYFLELMDTSSDALNPALLNNIGVLQMLVHQHDKQAKQLFLQALSIRADYQDAQTNLNELQKTQPNFKMTQRPLRLEVVHTDHYKLK